MILTIWVISGEFPTGLANGATKDSTVRSIFARIGSPNKLKSKISTLHSFKRALNTAGLSPCSLPVLGNTLPQINFKKGGPWVSGSKPYKTVCKWFKYFFDRRCARNFN